MSEGSKGLVQCGDKLRVLHSRRQRIRQIYGANRLKPCAVKDAAGLRQLRLSMLQIERDEVYATLRRALHANLPGEAVEPIAQLVGKLDAAIAQLTTA